MDPGGGPMQQPRAHPGTARVVTCPLPVATQPLETASLSAACPGPCPDPTVHPGSGREAHTRPHSGGAWTLLPRPNENGFWMTRHVAGLSAPLPPTDRYCGGPGGARADLGVPGRPCGELSTACVCKKKKKRRLTVILFLTLAHSLVWRLCRGW